MITVNSCFDVDDDAHTQVWRPFFCCRSSEWFVLSRPASQPGCNTTQSSSAALDFRALPWWWWSDRSTLRPSHKHDVYARLRSQLWDAAAAAAEANMDAGDWSLAANSGLMMLRLLATVDVLCIRWEFALWSRVSDVILYRRRISCPVTQMPTVDSGVVG